MNSCQLIFLFFVFFAVKNVVELLFFSSNKSIGKITRPDQKTEEAVSQCNNEVYRCFKSSIITSLFFDFAETVFFGIATFSVSFALFKIMFVLCLIYLAFMIVCFLVPVIKNEGLSVGRISMAECCFKLGIFKSSACIFSLIMYFISTK